MQVYIHRSILFEVTGRLVGLLFLYWQFERPNGRFECDMSLE